MITKEQAESLTHNTELYFLGKESYLTTSNQKIFRCRVTGKCKTWKTMPNRFRLPVKFGLYESGHIDQDNQCIFYDSLEDMIKDYPNAAIQKGLK